MSGYEIAPGVQPETREHAIALAQAWGHTLSHQNVMMRVERIDEHGPRRFETLVAVAQADLAEVQRLVALALVLPSEADS